MTKNQFLTITWMIIFAIFSNVSLHSTGGYKVFTTVATILSGVAIWAYQRKALNKYNQN